jgi:Mg2+ and Co2+ transporter CorA
MTHEEEIAQLRAENAGLNNLLRALALTVNELLRMYPLDVLESETLRRARDVTDEIISAVEKRQRGGHAN